MHTLQCPLLLLQLADQILALALSGALLGGELDGQLVDLVGQLTAHLLQSPLLELKLSRQLPQGRLPVSAGLAVALHLVVEEHDVTGQARHLLLQLANLSIPVLQLLTHLPVGAPEPPHLVLPPRQLILQLPALLSALPQVSLGGAQLNGQVIHQPHQVLHLTLSVLELLLQLSLVLHGPAQLVVALVQVTPQVLDQVPQVLHLLVAAHHLLLQLVQNLGMLGHLPGALPVAHQSLGQGLVDDLGGGGCCAVACSQLIELLLGLPEFSVDAFFFSLYVLHT
mmetsp:Transcript_18630/g.40023  ORF Transcript_18630/g.40023 Transcript_18630/m.40023 type:complete len:281 (-) Transcript_18630:553-1395(-)